MGSSRATPLVSERTPARALRPTPQRKKGVVTRSPPGLLVVALIADGRARLAGPSAATGAVPRDPSSLRPAFRPAAFEPPCRCSPIELRRTGEQHNQPSLGDGLGAHRPDRSRLLHALSQLVLAQPAIERTAADVDGSRGDLDRDACGEENDEIVRTLLRQPASDDPPSGPFCPLRVARAFSSQLPTLSSIARRPLLSPHPSEPNSLSSGDGVVSRLGVVGDGVLERIASHPPRLRLTA